MSDLLGISSSAVSTYQRSLAVISNNIANAATEGYSRQDISTQASPTRAVGNNYLGTGVFFDGVKRQYDSFVESNLRNSNSDLQSQKPVVEYTNRVIDVMGGQTSGLISALDQFFSSARSLSADPASTVLRGSFLRDAEGIASRFSQLSAQLDLVDAETKEAVESNVNQINALSQQLARVNTQLSRIQSVAKQPPELLDQRDSILLKMADFAKVNTRFEDNGVVTVGLGATADQEVIVKGRDAQLLGVKFESADPEKFRLVLDPYGSSTPVMGINSGELAGMMAFREQVLGSTRSSLDALAQALAHEINTLHESGVDAYGQTGKALFDFDPAMAHASAGLRITTKDPLNIAAAAAFRVIENASNTGTADAMVRYQAPAYAGAAALDQVLVNNSNAVAGAKLNVAANPGALPVSYIPAGMRDTTIYLDTLNEGQNLQILTRDGRHLVGQTLGDELQDRIMTEASGMELNATYSNSLLNIEDDTGYRKMPVFYGARAQAVAIQQFDSQGKAITPKYETPVLSSGRISSNWAGLPAENRLNLNGVQLGALTPSTGTSVQAKDVSAWLNAANAPGVRAVAENRIEIPVQQLKLTETLSLNNIAIPFASGGYQDINDLVTSINQRSDSSQVVASLSAQGNLVLTNAPGFEGEDIKISGIELPGMVTRPTYIEFSGYGLPTESITIARVSTAVTTNGQFSTVGNLLYRGNGIQAKLVGEIDAVKNGQAGQPLRINLVSSFQNGDFESSIAGDVQVNGWQVVNQRVRLGGADSLAGFPTPNDTQPAPNGSGETASVSVGTTYATQVIDTGSPETGLALKLNISNTSIDSYGVLHGPYVVSENAVSIQAGGSVSFDWKAEGGSDNFDVYAYLLNEDTGETIELLNQTGGTTPWATETRTINTAGDYKFVFISGTYDATGGTAAGAQLYIDNVSVQSTVPSFSPTESDLGEIKSLVNYSNSGSFSQLQRNSNALGLNSGVITGQVRLERTDGTLKSIGLSIEEEGSAADLQRLGFRAAAYIDGPAADDLLVFVSGSGAAQIAASYTTENLDTKEKLRNNPMTLKFVTATRFTITDQKTGTLLAEREFDSALPDASIHFQGLNLTFSKPPQIGDSFVLDGNRDGTGNNENMLEIVALESKPVMGNGKTLGSAFIDHVNDMGNVSRQASIVQSALTVVHDQAVASRDAVSGVSLDEEATNLIRFQQAYQASAKVMQVASQLFDSVLQIR